MQKKLRGLVASSIFVLLPLLAWSVQIETQISADTITVEKGEVLYAEGNVLVSMETRKLKRKLLNLTKKQKKLNLQIYKISKMETLSVFQLWTQ